MHAAVGLAKQQRLKYPGLGASRKYEPMLDLAAQSRKPAMASVLEQGIQAGKAGNSTSQVKLHPACSADHN